jgi:uncharacterized protein DUF6600
MKRHTTTALLLAALALPLGAAAQDQQDYGSNEVYPVEPVGPEASDYDVSVDVEGGSSVSFSTFDEPLRGYGDWVSVGAYGTVWRPRVPAGWRPYYYGRWEWTTEGWLWVSDEPFGWATYHYGRWTFDRGYGWLWVPGFQWAPAWVSWRYSGDVVGWAPLAPGLSLYVTDFAFIDFWWTFVPTVRFCGVPIHVVAYAPGHARRWYDTTRPAPPRSSTGSWRTAPGRQAPPAWGGPAPRFVEERVGRPLRPARIVPAGPGNGRVRPGEIGVYRPEARPRGAPGGRETGRPPAGWDRRDERGRGTGANPPPSRGGGRVEERAPFGGGRGTAPAVPPGLERRDRGAVPPGLERRDRGAVPPGLERRDRGAGPPAYAPPRGEAPGRAPERVQPLERAPAYQPPARPATEPAPSRGGGGGSDRGHEGDRGDRGDRGERRH